MLLNYSPRQALTQAKFEKLRKKATVGRINFDDFLWRVSPDWQWNAPHLVHIRQQLEAVTSGDTRRLMLFLPPRHGKSEMTTVRFAAWRLTRNPAQRIVIGSYGQTLANKFSRKIRRIAFAQGVPIDSKRTAVDDWETLQGGGVQAAGCELAQEETAVSMETAVLSFRGVFAREHMGAAYVA